ncbi:MAG: tetratricopeptide repeat protein [Terriglobia bacterium]
MSGSLSESETPIAPFTPLTARDREELAEIVALVANSRKQGCVYFGICNNRLKIASLEAALERDLRVHGIETARAVLAETADLEGKPSYQIPIPDPVAYFAAIRREKTTLFLVHGLAELIRAETEAGGSGPAPVSQRLNYGRELFRREAICVLFWIDPETSRYLAERARDFWSFRSGSAQFESDRGETSQEPRGEWQAESGSRWLGDLQEKLDQLSVYRSKSPPDEGAIASLLLDIGRLRVERHETQEAFEALHEAEEIFGRLGNPHQLSNAKTWLARAYKSSGRLDRAEEFIRAAIAIDSELQNEESLAADFTGLSQIYRARGELGEAKLWLTKALALAEVKGSAETLATIKANLEALRGREQARN